MKTRHVSHVVTVFLVLLLIPAISRSEDWPTYRHDRLRTARTEERLQLPLAPIWTFASRQAAHAPKPTVEPQRANFPECSLYTLPIIAAGESVFFSSAIDGRVVCLDASTGSTTWEFIAGAAVNRTPMFYKGRIHAGSDDGHVYCLDAASGKVVWTFRAAPRKRQMLAYGRMISSWPVRTDVLVADDVAYFAAGVFPHDGTFVYALDARSGRLLWRNGTQSEDGGQTSLAPGGHLMLTQTQIFVPKDFRGYSNQPYGAPSPFRRADGHFDAWPNENDPEKPKLASNSPWTRIFWPLHGVEKAGVRYGGSNAWLVENEERARKEVWKHDIPGRWTDYDSGVGIRIKGKPVVFRYDPDHANVIIAGDTLFHTAFDVDPEKGTGSGLYARGLEDGAELWSAEIPARANQVIAANGRLFVGTRSGTIHAFASESAETSSPPGRTESVEETVEESAHLAKAIVDESGHREGYALVLDCESGDLALELARASRLAICAVFGDIEQMTRARRRFSSAGVHLSRISTHLRSEEGPLPFPSFFADLIVSESAAHNGSLPDAAGDWTRLLKPIRGIALFGGRDGGPERRRAIEAWTSATGMNDWNLVEPLPSTLFVKHRRPRLPDAGGWTHMHADPGNTSCSHDGVLRGPLGVAWYGPPTITRPGKHTSIVVDGILVVPEPHSLEACDQYTGRRLWRFEAGNIGASLAASRSHIYARYESVLLQIDLLTGKHLRSFLTPFGKEHSWTWFAADLDGKTIYGAAANGVWATEMESGDGNIRWVHGGPKAAESERLGGSIAMSDGRIYILGGEARNELRESAIEQMRSYFRTQPTELREEFEKQVAERDIRELTTIDARSGKILYRTGVDITNCGGKWLRPAHFGGKRHYNPYVFLDIYAHGNTVVIGSASRSDKGWGMWNGGAYKARALTAYDGETGKLLWYRFTNHRTRPVIIGDTIHAEPWGFDLRTGAKKKRAHPITGAEADWAWCRFDKQCGVFSASRHFLFGRNKGFGYKDLARDDGLYTFWHSRSNCYVDHVSGGGLMIKPPQAIYCDCMWSLPFSVALGQVADTPPSAPKFAQPGPSLPVRHLGLDVGGNGDRRDSSGKLWISATKRHRNHLLLLGYDAQIALYEGGQELRRSATFTRTKGANVPFVFASSIAGLRTCVLPLADLEPDATPLRYSVRLGFAAPPGDVAGQRVFDVRLDGKTVLEKFDIARDAGGAEIAIWREFDLDLARSLTIELLAADPTLGLEGLPVLSGIEVQRKEEKRVTAAITGETWLDLKTTSKTLNVSLSNLGNSTIRGRLELETSATLVAAVDEEKTELVTLEPSATKLFEVTIRVADLAKAQDSRLELDVRFRGDDNKLLVKRAVPIEWLGSRRRRVLHGGSRPIRHESLGRSWSQRILPHHGNEILWTSRGSQEPEGSESMHESTSVLWFHIPQDLRERKIHRARLRLHVAPQLGEMLADLISVPPSTSKPQTDVRLRRLVGPPWPDVNKIGLESLPETTSESAAIARTEASRDVLEADLPGGAVVDPKDGNIYLQIDRTSPGATVFWGASSQNRRLAPILVIDYEDGLRQP